MANDLPTLDVMKNLADYNAANPPAPKSSVGSSPIGGAVLADGTVSQSGVGGGSNRASAADFTSAATTPLTTTQPVPATSSTGLAATTASFADTAKKSLEAKIAELTKTQTTDKSTLQDLIGSIGGQATKKVDAYSTVDSGTGLSVNDLKKQTDDITSQMEAGNRSADAKVRSITEQNKTGMFGAGAQGEIDRIKRENASYQADLAITLAAKTRQYSTAKGIIDAKIDAETEGLKTRLDGLKLFYDENKSLLSTAEQEKFQIEIKDAQNTYDDTRDEKKKIGEIQIAAAKNGANPETIRAIGQSSTLEDATVAAGNYLETNAGNFTTSQVNKGSALAGLDRDQFKALDSMVQNWYINNTASVKAFNQAISDIASGSTDAKDFKEQIDNSALSQTVKDYMKNTIDARFPSSGGGFWSSIGNFFSNAWNSIGTASQ